MLYLSVLAVAESSLSQGLHLTNMVAYLRVKYKIVNFLFSHEPFRKISSLFYACERSTGIFNFRLAAHINGYKCFQIELSRGYDYAAFHDDLKKLYDLAGVQNQHTVFLFTDTQVQNLLFL